MREPAQIAREVDLTIPTESAKVRGESASANQEAAGKIMERDYTPYQQKIIKRYYDNRDSIQRQRLAELVSELCLSEGKKRQRVWKNVSGALEKLGFSQQRIDHLVKQDNPALVAELVKELQKKK
jgi:hypothetical protein